ncbi:MAG: hybrid sensor histidine kinase/response regulator [Proteobacteria bacterium]|nr:hybrid sensor histidine kinase/response regulator [Pseudomonadota bacterium]
MYYQVKPNEGRTMAKPAEQEAHVLIVDDTPKNIQVLGTILREKNYRISLAQNGLQALDVAQKVRPDLILLDVMMPELDGFETCRRLKEMDEIRDTPVIFLTAKTESEDIVKGFQLGAVDYVTKPFNSVELLARVETQLEVKFNRELVERQNNERKELLHILCHDLKNPLASVQSILDLVAERGFDTFRELEKYIRLSVENGLNIIELIRKLMALEESKFEVDLRPYDLDELLNEAQAILQHRLDEKKLTIRKEIQGNPRVVVDKTSFINSVLNNILSNAIKFSYSESEILISAQAADGTHILSVRDFGTGMPASLLKDLFDLNKATSRSGTEGETGTGFGMPLVRKFMSAYGGSIEIESWEKNGDSVDHGTEVLLILKKHPTNG